MPTVSAHFRSLYSSFRGMAHSTRVVRVLRASTAATGAAGLGYFPPRPSSAGPERRQALLSTPERNSTPCGRPASRRVRRLNFTANCARLRRRISTDPHGVITGSGRDRPTDRRTDRRTDLQGPSEPGPARPESVPFLISTTNDLWIIHSVSVGGRERERERERGTEQRPAPPLWRLN